MPPGQVLRQIDLGHHSLAADLLFIRANLYYGHHILTDEQLPWLDNFIDILLELDPDFKKAYLWGAMTTVYRKREFNYAPDAFVQRANRILARGVERFPDDHRFPMRIGFNLYYELGKAEPAIPHLERAARLPGAPPDLREKLVDLYTKKGRRRLAELILNELIMEAEDPTLSEALRARMARLYDRQRRSQLEEQHSALVQSWRSRYAYLPFDLYLLIQEP